MECNGFRFLRKHKHFLASNSSESSIFPTILSQFFFLFLLQNVNVERRKQTQRVPVHNVTPMLSAVNKLSAYLPTT